MDTPQTGTERPQTPVFVYPGDPDRDVTGADRDTVATIGDGLRQLTEQLEHAGCEPYGGGLGGQWGYGTVFENDTFGITPYCWCEQDDCPWCYGCHCPDDAYVYLVDGQVADADQWLAAPVERTATVPVLENLCDYCRGDRSIPPLFWHKPSGSTISWYKYIGRGMEITLHAPWVDILAECLASIPARVTEQQKTATAWPAHDTAPSA